MDQLKFVLILGIFLSVSFALGCNPGTSECIDSFTYHTCSEQAIWGEAQACTLGYSCSEGQCVPPIGCKPGTSECVSATTYHTCGDYAIWNPEQSCASGQTCQSGVCVGPTPQCNYQQTRCNPDNPGEMQICNQYYQWSHWKWCSISCMDGHCIECSPGDTRCSDSYSYQTCGSDRYWGAPSNCAQNYVCSKGSCVVSPELKCSNVGATRCSPDNAYEMQLCGSNHVWKDWEYCDKGCDYGNCVACYTGNKKCVGTSLYEVCNSQGQWGDATDCPSGYVCQNGNCQSSPDNKCTTLGQKRCSLNDTTMLQTCSNGAYVDYEKCDYGCFDGACAECKPGTKVCAGANNYRFCTENGQLSEEQACPSGYTCDDDGVCVETPQCSDGQKNCVVDTVYVCQNSTWKLLYQCPSDTNCKEDNGFASCVPQNNTKPDVKPVKPSGGTTSGGFTSTELALLALVIIFAVAATYFYVVKKK